VKGVVERRDGVLMLDVWVLLLPWAFTVLLVWGVGPVWRTAVRTGRWLKGGGRSRYFPSKHCTFTVYDREDSPIAYWGGVISIAAVFAFFLAFSVLLTIGYIERVAAMLHGLR
jgi:hypothetical protein